MVSDSSRRVWMGFLGLAVRLAASTASCCWPAGCCAVCGMSRLALTEHRRTH